MANLNINKSIIGGRLTADPELKQTASGISACTFTVAVNRKYSKDGQQEADATNSRSYGRSLLLTWKTKCKMKSFWEILNNYFALMKTLILKMVMRLFAHC